MPTNTLLDKWKSGQPAFGGWLSIPSSLSAEIFSHAGFDYVCIDAQHGLVDYRDATDMLVAIHSAGAAPIVRVPSNDFGAINKMLDAGALGIVVPMIETAADAAAVVTACRYPPAGRRSFGPTRAGYLAGPNYFATANESIACIPMIETRAALDNLEDILAVPGVDAVYVGPNDLSLALGQGPGLDNEGDYQAAYERIGKACNAHGVIAGIHANAKLAAKHVTTGYRMITISSDTGALAARAAQELRTARGG